MKRIRTSILALAAAASLAAGVSAQAANARGAEIPGTAGYDPADIVESLVFTHVAAIDLGAKTIAVDGAPPAPLGSPAPVSAAGLTVGMNAYGEIEELAAYFRERGLTLRFIEFMDVGNTNHWQHDQVVPAAEIVRRIAARWPLEPVGPAYRGEVASRYRYRDGRGEIGLISSVTEPFCSECHRARLSADGRLFTCLFAALGWDVLGAVRAGASDLELDQFVTRIWTGRVDRYSDERAALLAAGEVRPKAEMSYLGG